MVFLHGLVNKSFCCISFNYYKRIIFWCRITTWVDQEKDKQSYPLNGQTNMVVDMEILTVTLFCNINANRPPSQKSIESWGMVRSESMFVTELCQLDRKHAHTVPKLNRMNLLGRNQFISYTVTGIDRDCMV